MPHSRTAGSAPWLARALATVTGNLYLVLGTLVFGTLAALAGLLPGRRRVALGIMRLWAAGLLRASGVRLEVRGAGELDPKTAYVYLANHQSIFDVPAVLLGLPGRFRVVAKQSLFRIPFFGWALRVGGFVSVDRADRTAARESFAAAERELQRSGDSFLLFPEGTRSGGETLLPFKRGGFLLALRTGLPIVPVGIRGTRVVQGRKEWSIRPGTIEVRFGAPIAVADFGIRRKRELIAEVRRRLAELAAMSPGEVAEAG